MMQEQGWTSSPLGSGARRQTGWCGVSAYLPQALEKRWDEKPFLQWKELQAPSDLQGNAAVAGVPWDKPWTAGITPRRDRAGKRRRHLQSLLKCCLSWLNLIGKGSTCWYLEGFWAASHNSPVLTVLWVCETRTRLTGKAEVWQSPVSHWNCPHPPTWSVCLFYQPWQWGSLRDHSTFLLA